MRRQGLVRKCSCDNKFSLSALHLVAVGSASRRLKVKLDPRRVLFTLRHVPRPTLSCCCTKMPGSGSRPDCDYPAAGAVAPRSGSVCPAPRCRLKRRSAGRSLMITVEEVISLMPPCATQVLIEAAPGATIGAQYRLSLCLVARDCEGRRIKMRDCVVIVIAEC